MARVNFIGVAQRTFLYCKNVRKINVRLNSTLAKCKGLECLESRSLLHVRGKETPELLQGLITNDMNHFDDGTANIHALFLNNKGRVLYDTIIYKGQDETYYIECDSEIIISLQKHLTTYKMRRKIDIQPMIDKMKVWSVFETNLTTEEIQAKEGHKRSRIEHQVFPCGSLNKESSIDDIVIYEDPRIPDLAFRILSNVDVTRDAIAERLEARITLNKQAVSYGEFRYQLGIAEGVKDLPVGKPFPLEINSDYLHGISFHKGCYIGQELTARTHHTGVVRKRLMPLIFNEVVDKLNYDDNIVDHNHKVVGKFRGVIGKHGLGLMRVVESINAESLNISNKSLRVIKPCWWPIEQPKDKLKVDETKN